MLSTRTKRSTIRQSV